MSIPTTCTCKVSTTSCTEGVCCTYFDKTYEKWRDFYPTCLANFAKGRKYYPKGMMKNGEISPLYKG